MAIPSYLLTISLTYCICIYWIYLRAKKQQLNVQMALDLGFAIMIGGLVGSRGFHVFFEAPEHYIVNPGDIVKLWLGGFVYYGGLIGATLASAVFLYFKKEKFWHWADFFAPIMALGYGIGRIACFLNGCCYGTHCDLPWAVDFSVNSLVIGGSRHPTQLYATFWELCVVVVLLCAEKYRSANVSSLFYLSLTKVSRLAGGLFMLWIALHSVGRLLMEHYRDDYRGDLVVGLSVSTWLSIVFLILSLLFFARSFFKRLKV